MLLQHLPTVQPKKLAALEQERKPRDGSGCRQEHRDRGGDKKQVMETKADKLGKQGDSHKLGQPTKEKCGPILVEK